MGNVQFLHPPQLTADLNGLFARGIVSHKRDNWLVVHGTLRHPAKQIEILGREIIRPQPVRLRGFTRGTIEFDGGSFSDLIGGLSKDLVVDDAKLIPVTFDEILRTNLYETDHYCLSGIFVPDWGMCIAYFGRESWKTWNVTSQHTLLRQLEQGRRRGLP